MEEIFVILTFLLWAGETHRPNSTTGGIASEQVMRYACTVFLKIEEHCPHNDKYLKWLNPTILKLEILKFWSKGVNTITTTIHTGKFNPVFEKTKKKYRAYQ